MPKKSRRVAARQAELGQRKRRTHKHSVSANARDPKEQQESVQSTFVTAKPSQTENPFPMTPKPFEEIVTSQAGKTTPQVTSQEVLTKRSQQRPLNPAPNTRAMNPYIWPEIRRIGAITSLVFVILAVLTLFLR